MTYYVDSQQVEAETGYGTAYTKYTRRGGGAVWCPHLYEPSQSVAVYNWRYGSKLTLSQSWINDLLTIDRLALGI